MSPTVAGTHASSPGRFQELLSELQQEHSRQLLELQQEVRELRAENKRLEAASQPNAVQELTPDVLEMASVCSDAPPSKEPSHNDTTASTAITSAKPISAKSAAFSLKATWTNVTTTRVWGFDLDKNIAKEHVADLKARRDTVFSAPEETLEEQPKGIIEMLKEKYRDPAGFAMHPSSKPRIVWDLSGLTLIAYDTITIPLMLCFEPHENDFLYFMSWLTLIFWSVDMVLSLFTGFYTDGKLDMIRSHIRKNYFMGWFWVDCIVVFPDWFFRFYGHAGHEAQLGHLARVFKIARSLRLLRMLKLKRILLFIYDMLDSEYMFLVFGLAKMLLIILVLNHFVACMWYGLGSLSMHSSSSSDTGKNWLEDVGMTPVYGQSLAWKYTTALHWSITQFTPASMDCSATNIIERVFSILVLFWALVALSSIIANVTASMTAIRNMGRDETKKLWMLRRYLKRHQISVPLRHRIHVFVEWHQATNKDIVKEKDVALLSSLSTLLRTEIRSELGTPILSVHPLFQYMAGDSRLRSQVSMMCMDALNFKAYAKDDCCFMVEYDSEAIYFVASGTYNYNLAGDFSIGAGIIGKSRWLSEGVLWTNWRHYGTLVANTPGELYSMTPAKFASYMTVLPRSGHLAKAYGEKFIAYLNSCNPSKLSDALYDVEQWADIPTCDVFKPIAEAITNGEHKPKRHEEQKSAWS